MHLQRHIYRKVFLASLLLLLLGLWLSSSFSVRTSHAVSPSGPVFAWGYNEHGELGNSAAGLSSNTPVAVSLPAGVTITTISTGSYHTLAIGSDGKLYAWGSGGTGALGDGTSNQAAFIPTIVNLPAGVTPTAIAAGSEFSLAIGNDGKLYVWGRNDVGQLGDGGNTDKHTPEVISLGKPGVHPVAISAGFAHSMAIGNDGQLYVWGYNGQGQLGDGTYTKSFQPEVVSLSKGVSPVTIAAGGYFSMVIGSDGKLYTWGSNNGGVLGDGTNNPGRNVPMSITFPNGISPVKIAGGDFHAMAIGNDGNFYIWGLNDHGQLGNGTTTSVDTPTMLNLPNGAAPAAMAGGKSHTVVLDTAGKVYTWGYNQTGQLGDGTNTDSDVPVSVDLPVPALAVSAGQSQGLAILSPPALSINNVTQSEGTTGTSAFTFTVTLAYSVSQTVTVDYATADGTATAPSDYTATSGTLSFAPGVTSQTITVLVNGDTEVEGDETFTVNLSNPVNATIATAQGIGTIVEGTVPPPPPTVVKKPNVQSADLIAQLRVSPDREFGLDMVGDNTLVYSLTVKNVGPGKANNVSVRFPIDPQLVIGYVSSDEAGVWVQQIVTDTDTPYILVSIPAMENGASHSLKVAMRAGTSATAGSSLFTTYNVLWDDGSANHRSQRSNGVRVALTDGTSDRNDTDGAVQLYSVSTDSTKDAVTLSGDFYAPGEWIDLWYTDAANKSSGIGRYQADPAGKLSVTVDVSELSAGSYVIAGRGIRTDITGAAAITISESNSASHAKTISVNSLSSPALHSLTEWASSK